MARNYCKRCKSSAHTVQNVIEIRHGVLQMEIWCQNCGRRWTVGTAWKADPISYHRKVKK